MAGLLERLAARWERALAAVDRWIVGPGDACPSAPDPQIDPERWTWVAGFEQGFDEGRLAERQEHALAERLAYDRGFQHGRHQGLGEGYRRGAQAERDRRGPG